LLTVCGIAGSGVLAVVAAIVSVVGAGKPVILAMEVFGSVSALVTALPPGSSATASVSNVAITISRPVSDGCFKAYPY
jgi:hypothetical protein